MKRIVAGLDGSDASQRAAALALELSRQLEARLFLVTVVPPVPVPQGGGRQEGERAEAESILSRSLALLEAKGSVVERVVLTGEPAEALCELARAEDVVLVAVGRSGRGAVSRLLLGSVSDRLVRRCPRPVLVVH
ncbi:MAG: universal stress protein [Deltaproteobacteria bacterium]|nr:universal stress protein [Deltaproteobacteria bacterium]